LLIHRLSTVCAQLADRDSQFIHRLVHRLRRLEEIAMTPPVIPMHDDTRDVSPDDFVADDGAFDLPDLSGFKDPKIAHLRVPPHSIEAESSVLGGLLLDNGAWDRVGDLLADGDFYRYEHRLIFSAMARLINDSKPADVITVFEQLRSLGQADETGGLMYLNQLAQYVPSAGNIRRYAEIVRERSILRKLVSASEEISASAYGTEGASVAQVLDQAETKILAIGEEGSRLKAGFQNMDKLVVQLIDRVNEMSENPNDITGVPTGFYDFDRMTSGMQAGDLIILAARPSMGKTSLAINIAEHVALNEGLPVAVFSMEMGAAQLAIRVMGSIGRIDQSRLRTGKLTDDDWPRFFEAAEKLKRMNLHIDETPGLTPGELRANARRLARAQGKLGLIVVDYLQLMSGSSGGADENRATEIGEISRGLKGLAKELQCPVIALSQLNRSVETRTDKRPMMSDLRESGAIEQDADVIMFIYRDDYYNKDSKEPGVSEIIIGKQRNGPTGTVKLAFLKPLTKFENLASGTDAF
jgi:replicative DNA helicase